ncbi:MAG: IPT/TIG domain-containing protein [Actinomycetota bacterium]|nr:IPT/TIG domain-containing protein [Actinomycetota bacterium]
MLPSEPRAIVELFPSSTPVDGSFNVQPDGRSAIAVKGTGFTQRDKIYWDGTRLVTTYGDSTLLTALVPKRMLTKAGDVVVSVRDPVFLSVAEVRANFRLVAAR